MKQYRFRHVVNGKLVESDLVVLRSDQGESIPDDESHRWCKIEDGPLLLALRISGTVSLRENRPSNSARVG